MPDPVYPVLHYAKLISEKKAAYAEYHRVRNEMKELLTVKANVDLILGVEPGNQKGKIAGTMSINERCGGQKVADSKSVTSTAFMVIEV